MAAGCEENSPGLRERALPCCPDLAGLPGQLVQGASPPQVTRVQRGDTCRLRVQPSPSERLSPRGALGTTDESKAFADRGRGVTARKRGPSRPGGQEPRHTRLLLPGTIPRTLRARGGHGASETQEGLGDREHTARVLPRLSFKPELIRGVTHWATRVHSSFSRIPFKATK